MVRLIILPTPLGGAICKTLYIELSSVLNTPLIFGYDVGKSVEYAEVDVDPSILGKGILKVLSKYDQHISELPRIPVILIGAPGTDMYVMKKRLGISPSKPYKSSVPLELFKIVNSKYKNLSSELSIYDVILAKNSLTFKLGGNIPAPAIIESEVFYELGRYGGIKDLVPSGPPRRGKVSITLGPTSYASLLLTILAYQVSAEDPYYLFLTIDYPLVKTIHPSIARVMIELRDRLVRYIKGLNIGVYAEDFDSLRLALLYKTYHLVKRHYENFKELLDASYVFHLLMSTGRKFVKTLEYTIELNSVNVLDNAFRVLGINKAEALNLSKTLADTLLALIRASKSAQVIASMPVIERVKIYIRNLALSILEANIDPILDNIYLILRTLREEDFRNMLYGNLRNVVNVNIDTESEITGKGIEEILQDLASEEGIVVRSKEEYVKELAAKRLRSFIDVIEKFIR